MSYRACVRVARVSCLSFQRAEPGWAMLCACAVVRVRVRVHAVPKEVSCWISLWVWCVRVPLRAVIFCPCCSIGSSLGTLTKVVCARTASWSN